MRVLWSMRQYLMRVNEVIESQGAGEATSQHSATANQQGLIDFFAPVGAEETFTTLPARQVKHAAKDGPTRFERPAWSEVWILVGSVLVCGLSLWFFFPHTVSRFDASGRVLIALAVGLALGASYAAYQRGFTSGQRPTVSVETVLLWSMALASLGLTASSMAEESSAPSPVAESKDGFRIVWRFRPPEPCSIASSPTIDGDNVFIGVVHGAAFRSGAVYCLDRATGKRLWVFNNKGKMRDSFSSPYVADGKVYIGEGFHQHSDCRLYCLDAKTGAKLWDFPTKSHTESSPVVANGKVYFGAGDDGLICVDAETGKEVWHYQGSGGLHVDAGPMMAENRIYCGSGIGDIYKETCCFCLDALTGAEVWRVPTPLPVWGTAAVGGGQVYIPLGNGNFLESDKETPKGAVLCVDAKTGKRNWQFDAGDGVLTRVVDKNGRLYFGSRDQSCYCVDANTGKLVWKEAVGSPVVAGPTLYATRSGATVYVPGVDGKLLSLRADAQLSGDISRVEWAFDVARDNTIGNESGPPVQIYSSPTLDEERRGERRHLYFGCTLDSGERGVLYCLEDTLERK